MERMFSLDVVAWLLSYCSNFCYVVQYTENAQGLHRRSMITTNDYP